MGHFPFNSFNYQGSTAYSPYLALENHNWKELFLSETRSIPFAIATVFLALQILHVVISGTLYLVQHPQHQDGPASADAEAPAPGLFSGIKKHVKYLGGVTITGFMAARMIGSISLYILSRRTVRSTCEIVTFSTCPETYFTATFLYSSIMGVVALVSKGWCKSATRSNIIVLLSAWGVYLYRDLWPLATYYKQPADIDEGNIVFVKIGILTIIAIIVPLFIPRRYVPVDPKNPMPNPNAEQTSSLFSILTYTFLDEVIFLGYKVPHLAYHQLPPLADYDSAEYQTVKSFPHLDVFAGAKQRPLFIRLLRVYWKEYSLLTASLVIYSVGGFVSPIGIYQILKYLETGGDGQSVKPWLWIIWLFMGPMIQSICWQFYIYIATRVLALTEILVTQLVFEHSLRIRFKAETSTSAGSRPATRVGTPIRPSSPVGSTNADSTAGGSETASIAESTAREASEASTVIVREASTSTATTIKGDKNSKPNQKGGSEPPKNDAEEHKPGGNLVGKINNLVTTDLNNIVSARDFLWLIIGIPLNVTLCLIFLYRLLGWSCFVGFSIMIVLLPVPGYVARAIQKAQKERMKVTDARIQAVSETMNIIRMVKLFGWENRMLERLKSKREEELKLLWKIKWLNCVSAMIGFIFPTITMLTTYGLFTVVMKEDLTPSIIFSSMAVFSTLRGQLFRLMQQSVTLLQGKVSLDRLDEFLRTSELLDSFLDKTTPSLNATDVGEVSEDIGFRNASFSWAIEEEEDSGIVTPSNRVFRLRVEGELLFKRNAINLVIGPTGSGKTSILMALLGEMHFIPTAPDSWFNLPRKGGVAYAAQESWVQNETIRNNILFGSEYDEERYKAVIKQCALETDLELFEAGDATEVGERGLTLSGGQKARITLARAIYSTAEIILLDDVLAALDVHTSSWIVDHCFRGDLIKNRTLIIVTHNVALVTPVADYIVSIGTNGKIKSRGNQVSVAASRDPKLAKEIKADEASTARGEEVIDSGAPIIKKVAGDGKLTVAEEIVEGHVTWKSFKLLLVSLGGDHPVIFYALVIAGLLLNEWTFTFQIWYMGYWGSQYESHPASEVPVYWYLGGYAGITLFFCIAFSTSYMVSMHGSIRASRVINATLIESILGSTLRWLDQTPVGRIIARCTQDIRSVDGPIPQSFLWVTDCLSGVFAKLGSIVIFTPIFIWPGLTIGLFGLWLGNMYLKAQLSVKRETSNARAPMLSHFSASIHGLTSIRAYNAEERFKKESLLRINHYTRVSRMSYNLNRWIGVRMDVLGAGFTAALATYLVYGRRVGTSNTGFSLNMALDFTTLILYFVRIYNDFEVEANSLERIQGYIDIEHEPKATEEGKPPASWPTSGDIRVENLCARYSKDGPQVLHNLSFHIASGERVGVVGRTGSGKSSLTLSLLRCIVTEGDVYFDGIPTSAINLDALRTSITIIPQTPELLSGTLRENLDPFDQNDDAVLNAALDDAGLFALQEDAGEASLSLDTKIASGGGNLSVGQRQIIALARAMIRGSKLLMLDEATSAIDYRTDAIIQRTLRTQLSKDVTVITVAHRLQTIMDSDKIMVLDSGRIAEFGKPSDLLQNEDGLLRALVNESSDKDKLYELAGMSLN